MILLRSAVRITHKAQGVTCLAAKWHVCTTIDIFESPEADTETPTTVVFLGTVAIGMGSLLNHRLPILMMLVLLKRGPFFHPKEEVERYAAVFKERYKELNDKLVLTCYIVTC